MNRRHLLSMLLVVLMVAASLAACTQTPAASPSQGGAASAAPTVAPSATTDRLANLNPEGYPVVKEPITLKIMGESAATQGDWAGMKFFKVLSEKTNIKFEFTTAPIENWEERKNLAFASNNLPDIFYGCILTTNDEQTYGGQGYLIPLESLLDQYSVNFKGLMDKDANIKKDITTPDGHIYALPFVNDMKRDLTEKLWFNKKWCDTLSIPVPTTTDELYTTLKAFKEKDPNGNGQADEIPMSFKDLNNPLDLRLMLSYWGLTVDQTTYISNKDGTLVFAPNQPEFKEYLTYMNKLYKEGLLDNESFTQTNEQLKAKGKETPMKLGAFVNAGAFLVVPNENNEDYIALPPLKTKDGKQEWLKYDPVFAGAFAVTKNCALPEAAIRMVDWMYSSEGALVQMRGVENEDYVYTNAEKTQCKLNIPEGFANFEEYRAKKLTPNSGSRTPGIGGGTLPVVYNPLNDYINQQVDANLVPYWKTPLPHLYFSADDQKKVATISADVNSYVVQSMARFITGDLNIESGWATYISDLDKMGIQDYVKIYQDSYNVWNKN
jgi:putative aldouronate transport system substrate-binding protein